MKLHIGDQVLVKIGKDKGKQGKIEKILPKLSKVVVAGVNMSKKNMKPSSSTKQGGIIDIVKPLAVAKVSFVCPKCNLPSRIGYVIKNNEKNRICKKCKQIVD